MIGWHHHINGHGLWWTLGVGDWQGGLACCSSWGGEESTRLSNWTELSCWPLYASVCVCVCVCAQSLSHVWLFATSWTIAHQAPLSMEFSSKNTEVGCHFLLQRIFPTQGLNPCLLCLLHWQADSLPLAPLGKPHFMPVVTPNSWGESSGYTRLSLPTPHDLLGWHY